MKKIVGYTRVSTARQGQSGLGLEAQQTAINTYAAQHGCEVIATFIEIESGRKNDRPQLAKAIATAKRKKATLLFAKVDRLARNARFLLTVVESGADVVFCDLPNIPPGPTGKFILTQMASVAELEAGLISKRTKDALVAARARGSKLGAENERCRNLTRESVLRGAEAAGKAVSQLAREAYEDLLPRILALRLSGESFAQIAVKLNEDGQTTRQGKPLNAMTVLRILKRSADQ
ncbi:MAG: recombinase family protein [Planctomycetes bacterium]|nr:recombinase family protein [Planctomycetota bacterium]